MSVKNWGSLRVRSTRLAAIAALSIGAAGLAGCGSETLREGQASSYLIIQNLEGQRGGPEASDPYDHVLNSDVVTEGSYYEDNGRVRMTAAMKDVTNPAAPSTNNTITVNRYRVVYRRTDGRNTPGVDVPYAFDGAVTFSVEPGGTMEVPFTLVRVNAKLESPLINMAGGGGAVVLATIADVTFFGRDQTGRELSVTGSIGVNFADYGDPDS